MPEVQRKGPGPLELGHLPQSDWDRWAALTPPFKWPDDAPLCAKQIDDGPEMIFDGVSEADKPEQLKKCIRTVAAGWFGYGWSQAEVIKVVEEWPEAGLDYPLDMGMVRELVAKTAMEPVDCLNNCPCPPGYCEKDKCEFPPAVMGGAWFDPGKVPAVSLPQNSPTLERLDLLKAKGRKKSIDPITGGSVLDEAGQAVMEPDYTLSPTKAAATVVGNMDLCLDATDRAKEPVIWQYDRGIWVPTGEKAITNAIDEAVGDLSYERGLRETLRRVRARVDQVAFNTDPALMPLLNGAVDLRTGRFRALDRSDHMTFRYNAGYDPAADFRPFLWFLCTSLPDPRDVLTAIDLYTAAAIRLPFEVFVLLFGGGSNGKGIFEKVLQHLLTHDRTTALKFDELSRSRFGPGALLDKELWVVSEVETAKDATAALKRVSTGELIDTDVKYGGRKQGQPHVLPILDANNAFDFGDDSKGRRRRLIKLDFPFTFDRGLTDRPKDPLLLEKLTTPEALAGVVRLISIRAPSLLKDRRIYRRMSEEETESILKRQQHSLAYFCDECLTTETPDVPGQRLTTEAAYGEYLEYCRLFNIPTPAGRSPFGKQIRERFGQTSIATRIGNQGIRYYPGLWVSKSAKTAYAENCLRNRSYSTATGQQHDIDTKIPISEWIATAATGDWSSVAIEEILEEIYRMYNFINSCKSPQDITWRNYLDFAVASVAAVAKDRCIPNYLATAEKCPVAKGNSHVAEVSSIAQDLSEAEERRRQDEARKRTPEPKSIELTNGQKLTNLKIIRLLSEVDRFTGIDGHIYGPFRADEVASLPVIHAKNLITRGVASPINPDPGSESSQVEVADHQQKCCHRCGTHLAGIGARQDPESLHWYCIPCWPNRAAAEGRA
ncbi:MAG: hypothetical protein A4E45_02084 [Methanosaeta sp. PtaB.Bin039]|nr:MAG: hypothetical protein A4E45_02084 [Methanosaeta sp. PtaB.Bin039]